MMRQRPVQRALRAASPEIAEVEAGILEYFTKRVVPKNRKRPNLKLDENVAAEDESKDEGANGYARSLLLGLFTVRRAPVVPMENSCAYAIVLLRFDPELSSSSTWR
eukprot:6214343-Amphidinium_carterae.2